MSVAMRALLIAGSVLSAVYVLLGVRRSRMRTEDSVFWLLFAAVLVFMGIFPGVVVAFTRWIGVQSSANFVFLVIIFLLIIRVFLMDQRISRIQQQSTRTAQRIAIEELREELREREEREMAEGRGPEAE